MNDNKKINIKNAEEASGGLINFNKIVETAGDAGLSAHYCENCKKKLNNNEEVMACIKKGHNVIDCR